jgi:protein ImuA
MTVAPPASLTRLKRRLHRLEQGERKTLPLFPLGHASLDARLEGGLASGALHEVCAIQSGDHASASGFALMLALRASGLRPILWVREDRNERQHGLLYGPGLAELGINPEQLILVSAPDTLAALRAGADILGVMGLGAVVIEPWGAATALDLTASRKLVLAAERSGAPAFILRDGDSRFASAASTRWSVAAAPSAHLAGQAPGQTRLTLDLVRHRGGIAPFSTLVEWNRDLQSFAEPAPLSGALLSDAERGQMAA